MAKVKQSYVGTLNGGTTIGIQLPILVNSGADGSYVIAANQIAWGESHFYNETFGGTTEGLLTAIENTISTYAGDAINTAYARADAAYTYAGSAYTYASNVGAVADEAYAVAYYAKGRIDTFLDGENITEAVDTLKDIQNYITTHGEEAATMVTNITKAQNRADAAYTYASNVGAVADNAQNRADAAYTYASNVGAVADNAQNSADAAYAYASNVGSVAYNAQNRADAAYEYAGSAWTYAGDANDHAGRAYTYASNVGSVADEAYTVAYNAHGRLDAFLNGEGVADTVDTLKDIQNYITTHGEAATNMVTSITAAQNRADDAYTHADDVLAKAYEAITSSATDITYTFVSATSSQGKFISSVDILPKPDMPHDFEFRFTYYTLKAEDYWEEYVPAN